MTIAAHKRLMMKTQVKLLSAQPKVTQADKEAPHPNGVESGSLEETSETHYWNLKREGLHGKPLQIWYGPDVVHADLNNNDDAMGATRCSKSLEKKCNLNSPTASEDNQTCETMEYAIGRERQIL